MNLFYAVFLGDKQLKVFSYDTSISKDKERALKRAQILVNQNKIFDCDCIIEHFGLSGVGVEVKL